MRTRLLARLIPAALLATYGATHARDKALEAVEVFATDSSWRAASVGAGTVRDTPAKDVQQLDLVANLENVTDERDWAAAGDSRVNSNSPLLAAGMPRTLRLSAKLSF